MEPGEARSFRRPWVWGLIVIASVSLPAVAANAPGWVRIPPIVDRGGDPPPAIFLHWTHGEHPCYTCHPGIFPQARVGFTHEDMGQGRFCGACHDGRSAFSPDAPNVECATCHRDGGQ